jgi:hypothetical protein
MVEDDVATLNSAGGSTTASLLSTDTTTTRILNIHGKFIGSSPDTSIAQPRHRMQRFTSIKYIIDAVTRGRLLPSRGRVIDESLDDEQE